MKLSAWVLAMIGHLPITPTRKLPDALVVDVNLPFRRSCTWLAWPSVFGIVRENAPWGAAGLVNTLAKNGWRTGPERQSAMSYTSQMCVILRGEFALWLRSTLNWKT